MKFNMKDALVNGKIDRHALAGEFRKVAAELENGNIVPVSMDSGESHVSGTEWYKVSIKS